MAEQLIVPDWLLINTSPVKPAANLVNPSVLELSKDTHASHVLVRSCTTVSIGTILLFV
jgi:hypothetical protein